MPDAWTSVASRKCLSGLRDIIRSVSVVMASKRKLKKAASGSGGEQLKLTMNNWITTDGLVSSPDVIGRQKKSTGKETVRWHWQFCLLNMMSLDRLWSPQTSQGHTSLCTLEMSLIIRGATQDDPMDPFATLKCRANPCPFRDNNTRSLSIVFRID